MTFEILTQQVDAREGADVNPLKEFCSHISESFFEPDIQAARIILGTAFAHYIPNTPPIWMFVVGPPSSGKTSITVEALSGLQGMFGPGQAWGPKFKSGREGEDDTLVSGGNWKEDEAVEILSTINTNTFLSHQIGVDDPGLLEQLARGKFHMEKDDTRKFVRGNALVLIPDFTVMASMHREKRGEIMGQLRRIYDGKFEKKVGTRVTKIWEGKLSILAATTPVIDKYTSIDSALGERFIQINWRASDKKGRGAFALRQLMRGKNIKTPMKDMIRKMFAEAEPKLLQLPDDHPVLDRLAALAELIAVGRTSVFGHIQDKTYIVQDMACSEDVYRICIQFFLQLSGLCALQGHAEPTEQDIQDVLRAGIETLPTYRSIVLQAGIEGNKLRDYAGKWREKQVEATKMMALEMVERCDIGDNPVKLRKKWQSVVERCGFEYSTVFEADGAAGGRERAERAAEEEMDAGLDDSNF